MSDTSTLSIRPIIEYPREVRLGETYLMTVDLQPESRFDWHYEAEEYPVYCEVESNLFKVKSIEDTVIVLHRFGGSYSVAKFLLNTLQDIAAGYIKIKFSNAWGIVIRTETLEDFRILPERQNTDTEYYQLPEIITFQEPNLRQGLINFLQPQESVLQERGKDDEILFVDVLAYINDCVQAHRGYPLVEVETKILRYTWDGLSYEAMAKRMSYGKSTLRGVYGYNLWKLLGDVWPTSQKFNKSRFRQVAEQQYRNWRQDQSRISIISNLTSPKQSDNSLATLLPRLVNILKSGCNTLILTGARGMGKSHLIRSLESQLGDNFTQIIHHSTHAAPTWRTWHQQLFQVNTEKPLESSLTEDQLRQQVLQALKEQPYLLVIDRGEQFLDNPKHNDFIREIAATSIHQSCLLWSGNVLPNEIEKYNIPVEILVGLSFNEAKALLLDSYPHLSASITQKENYWQQLNELCGGNPRLLYKSVDAIQTFYNNQIEYFLPLPPPPSLAHYFGNLFAELSEPEQVLLYWLALQPLSWIELKKWPLFLPFDERALMQAWYMLQRRHLIKRFSSSDGLWCATPQYLGLYLINELQNIFVRELLEEKLYLFHTYPIVMPTAPLEHQKMFLDYLLKPVANALRKKLSIEKLQTKFCRLLGQLHDFFDPSRSTAAGNLFNLGAYMGISMSHIDWSDQTLWHVDLRVPGLKGIDFKVCQFKNVVLTAALRGKLVTALHPTGRAMAIGDEQGLLQIYQWTGHRFVLDWCCEIDFPIQEIIITDNDKLIVATIDQIKIWDAFTNKDNSYSTQLEAATLDTVAVRADGYLLATSLSDGSIQLWDLAWVEKNGEPLSSGNDNIKHLNFSPDGKIIAGYDNNNIILLWNQVSPRDTYTAAEVPLPLNPYGNFLTFKWTDTESLSVVEAVPEINSQEYLAKVVFRTFMVEQETLADDSIHFNVKELSDFPGHPHQAAFSDDGTYLIVCDLDHTVHLWRDMNPVSERAIKLPELPHALSISNGGRLLLCQDTSGISLWDLEQSQCVQHWEVSSDLDLYQGCQFQQCQGLSNDELIIAQRLGAFIHSSE